MKEEQEDVVESRVLSQGNLGGGSGTESHDGDVAMRWSARRYSSIEPLFVSAGLNNDGGPSEECVVSR